MTAEQIRRDQLGIYEGALISSMSRSVCISGGMSRSNETRSMKQLPQSASFRCSRRQAVQIGFGLFGFGLFGMGLDRFLQAASVGQTKDVSCIFLFLAGGPSQFETFDPKPHAPLEARGIWNPISTSVPGIQVCEKRPLLARRMDNLERFVSATGSGFESVDRFSAEATALLTTDAMRQAMNLEDEPEALRERSGQSGAVGDNVGRGHGRVWSDATNQPGPGARPLSRGWQRVVCRSGDESGCGGLEHQTASVLDRSHVRGFRRTL